MINASYFEKLGLTQEQTRTILDDLQTERLYNTLLLEAGIHPRIALKIIDATELGDVQCESEDLMRLKISEEWQDFMRKEKR